MGGVQEEYKRSEGGLQEDRVGSRVRVYDKKKKIKLVI